MAERKRYNVEVNGMNTMLKLNADEAKKRGLSDKDLAKKAASRPANKARGAANKGGAAEGNKAPADAGDQSDS